MANSVGQIATAVHYNAVGSKVNKVFGDIYSSAAVTDADRINTHKFGWGSSANIVANATDTITAEQLQGLVAKTNISINHTDITDSILVFAVPTNRTSIAAGTLIRAEDLNKIDVKFSPVLENNKHTTIDASNASAVVAPSSGYGRSTAWNFQLKGEHKFSWANYNKARYFFNAGGQLRVSLNMTGGTTAGYYNWSDVINEMGVLNFNWDTMTQSTAKTSGTSEGKGFYQLTSNYGDGSDTNTNEGLLFTSSGVTIGRKVGTYGYGYGYSTYGYGYGYITGQGNHPSFTSPAIAGGYGGYGYGYGYSGIYVSSYGIYSSYQQLKFRIYGKYIDSGAGVQFKIVLDDTTHANVIDGSITPTVSYLMPDTLTQGTTSLDVTPAPTFSVVNDFTSSDDS
tara:strand:- start:5342 stop:6529 length:1188 start_codon:yes stop_codon:yes gene_type:complete